MNLKDTYNRIADDWDKGHQADDWWVKGTNAFASLFKRGASVLDAGCGGGTKSRYLTDKGLRVTGVDFSEKLIAIARRKVPEADFRVLDLWGIESMGEAFDGVFAQAVLLHVPKAKVVEQLRRLSSVLRAGGYLYVAVKERKSGGPEEETKQENAYGYPFERFFSYFTMEELKGYLREVGLALYYESTSPFESMRWIQVIAQKP